MTESIKVFSFREGIRIPLHGSEHAAGFDFYAPNDLLIRPGKQAIIGTGIGFGIPIGWYGQIHGRSSLNKESILSLPGVIDCDYIGEVKVGLINLSDKDYIINKDNRIAQIIFTPCWSGSVQIIRLEDAESTVRGTRGFGSTGK